MCLPWNHKWETTDQWESDVWDFDYSPVMPIRVQTYIQQRCTHCGKEIVRKYRV